MNHVAFDVAPEKIEEYRDRLVAAGIPCTEVANHDDSEWGISDAMHPGVFVRSVYFQDPDGILLEFACWMRAFTPPTSPTPPPTPRRRPMTWRWPPSPSWRRPHPPPRRTRRRCRRPAAARPIRSTDHAQSAHAPPPPGPQGRSDRTDRDHHVRMALRGPRPRRRAWPLGWDHGRLVDRVRQQSRHPRPLRQGFRAVPVAHRALDPKLRELGQIRAGYAAASQFVFSQHAKSMRELGMPEEQITHIPAWSSAPEGTYNAAERAVLAYTDSLVYDHGRVPDELFAELRRHLDEVAILELTYSAQFSVMCSRSGSALRSRRFARGKTAHNHRPSRKARSRSRGRNRAASGFRSFRRLSVASLVARSASRYWCVTAGLECPSQSAITARSVPASKR